MTVKVGNEQSNITPGVRMRTPRFYVPGLHCGDWLCGHFGVTFRPVLNFSMKLVVATVVYSAIIICKQRNFARKEIGH
jgi:hypothetical protein